MISDILAREVIKLTEWKWFVECQLRTTTIIDSEEIMIAKSACACTDYYKLLFIKSAH